MSDIYQAIQFFEFGSPEVLQLVELSVPTPAPDQVLIRTKAAALNPIDYKTRDGSGFVAKALAGHLPSSLGYDCAGEIAAVGEQVKDFKVGDAVMGFAGFPHRPCCYAQFICATTNGLAKKPAGLDFLSASALPTAGLTALQALNKTEVKAGDVVLIHAAAGGVGHLAVQLAKARGATVIATASKANHAFLQQLGADQCIDYREQDFVEVITQPVDVVLDLVGHQTGIKSLEVLAEAGCLVSVPTITAEQVIAAAKLKNRRAFGLLKDSNLAELIKLAQLILAGKLRVELSQVFKLSGAVAAHQMLQGGHVRGKLVFDF